MGRLRRLRPRGLASVVAAGFLWLAGCGDPSVPPADVGDLSPAALWLRDYLQFETTGEPGRGRPAVQWLTGLLDGAPAVEIEVLDDGDGYPSLWAYLPPSRPAPGAGRESTLLLLHHFDVVAATGSWDHPPFSGRLVEGDLWGRGAIDSKGLGIAHLAAFLALAHDDAPRLRGVALMATADEERGGRLGVGRWLTHRPELFAGVGAVVNEGGINRGYQGRLHWWGIEIAQKRPLWLEARGPTAELIAGLRKLVDREYRWRVPAEAQFAFSHMAPHYTARWSRLFVDLERFVRPTGPTVMLLPGMESSFLDSIQINVLEVAEEGVARARIDARLLPDTDQAALLTEIASILGDGIEIEVLLDSPRVAPSPWSGPWIDILHQELRSVAPIIPQMAAGTTDSRYFRQRGIPAYGFSPFILDGEFTRAVHSSNERIPVVEFDRGVERMTRLVAAWAAGGGGAAVQSPAEAGPAGASTR